MIVMGETALQSLREELLASELAATLSEPIRAFERAIAERPSRPSLMKVDQALVASASALPGVDGALFLGPSGNLIAKAGTVSSDANPFAPGQATAAPPRTTLPVSGTSRSLELGLSATDPDAPLLARIALINGLDGQAGHLVLILRAMEPLRLRTDLPLLLALLGAATLAVSHLPHRGSPAAAHDPNTARLERLMTLGLLCAIGAGLAFVQALVAEGTLLDATLKRLSLLAVERHFAPEQALGLIRAAMPMLHPVVEPSPMMPDVLQNTLGQRFEFAGTLLFLTPVAALSLVAPCAWCFLAVSVATVLLWWPLQPILLAPAERRTLERPISTELFGALGWCTAASGMLLVCSLRAHSFATLAFVLGSLTIGVLLASAMLWSRPPAFEITRSRIACALVAALLASLSAATLHATGTAAAVGMTVTLLCLFIAAAFFFRYAIERDLLGAFRASIVQSFIVLVPAVLLGLSPIDNAFRASVAASLIALSLIGIARLPTSDALLLRRSVRLAQARADASSRLSRQR